MALDNAQFIAELSITDPPGTDPLSQGDDQIRTIKRATQQSFPNIDKAVTQTADQMLQMAIKNEANVFVAEQTIQDSNLVLNDVADAGMQVQYSAAAVLRWSLIMSAVAANNDWSLSRFDVLGAFVDNPMRADWVTGVVDFAHVPTIKGDPIWTAGEIKMLVQGAALPSNNWFLCNGTNGTVALQDRILGAQGVFTGTQTPFLDVQTDGGELTGSTVLTSNQMPSHHHSLRDLQTGGGISDGTALSNANSVGSIRNVTANIFTESSLSGQLVQDTGGSAGHTHTIPALECNPPSNDAFQVMPFTYFMQVIQYVP